MDTNCQTANGEIIDRRVKIIATIPAYNEEIAIGSVVLKARKYADEVIVIDDGSTDATAEIAGVAGATVIKHEENRGYGAALQSCFETARGLDADILVILDGDGQHNPSDIPAVIAPVLRGEADIAIGSRFLDASSRKKVPRYREFGIKVITFFTNLFSKEKVSDAQSGFRAYSKKAIYTLNIGGNDMSASAEILLEASPQNLKIKEVPIHVNYNVQGSTLNPFSHGLGVLGRIIQMVSERRPLIFFGVPGFLFVAAGVLLGLWLINIYNRTNSFSIALAFLVLLLIISGVLGLSTGLTLNALRNLLSKHK